MDINLLLKGINCKCGKFHTCAIEKVYIEENACKRLQELVNQYQSILLVADENTYLAVGEKVLSNLTAKKINKIIFSGQTLLIPNEQAILGVENALLDSQIIIAVGSGVIQDLCKYVSKSTRIPYIVVATAPSMDGYASDGAAMILNGMKVTVKAGLPKAIIADVDVIKNAPIDMIKAGFGDVVGKFSALNDWKLANLINGEYLCEFIYDLTISQIKKTLALVDGLLKRQSKSVKSLMEALVIIGILMSFAGSSRPASGSEHHLSHFFEITGILDGEAYLAHGLDVAYSTVITSKIRQLLIDTDFTKKLYKQTQTEKTKNLQRVYSTIANECIELQNKTDNYKDRREIYINKEKEIKKILRECPSEREIEKALSKAELSMESFYNFYKAKKIKDAVKYAKDLKDRFTVLWLCYDLLGGEINV